MIELFIETLTGTCFELRVSQMETVMAVKSKIQRMEGIPMSHQYLIWQNMELKDENRLMDYNITSGSKLKLVLAMRGGPINTHKIAMEGPDDAELAEYVDMSHAEFLESLANSSAVGDSQSNKQITLLVYRDGDQLNFFRVVDRGDGTLTPLSETCSEESATLEEEAPEPLTGFQQQQQKWQNIAKMIENNVTAAKMKKLCAKTRKLTVNQKKPENLEMTPSPPKSSKPNHGVMSGTARRLFKHPGLGTTFSPPSISTINTALQPPTPADLRPQTSADISAASEVVVDDNGDLVAIKPTNATDMLKPKLQAVHSLTELPTESNRVTTTAPSSEEPPHSPRTRRLMNALSESRKDNKRKPVVGAPNNRVPIIGQGLAFNRHEMYLRSYGLIPTSDSPDELSSISRETVSPNPEQRLESGQEQRKLGKLHETPHGVKYSTIGNSTRYNQRFSSTIPPPVEWPENIPTSLKPHNKLSSSIIDNKKLSDLDRKHDEGNIKSTALSRDLYSNYDKLRQKYGVMPPSLDSVTRDVAPTGSNWSYNHYHSNALVQGSGGSMNKGLRSGGMPSSLSKISSEEMDYREAPLPLPSPYHTKRTMRLENPLKEEPISNTVQLNSPHGEKTSRQSIREVVDLVNKAIDNNKLRNVKSPLKDHHRGNSGQRSGKHSNLPFQYDQTSTFLGSAGSRLPTSARQRNLPPIVNSDVPTSGHFLPPVKRNSKKKYCFLCRKKTGLASSFMCRCGNNFCTIHRYAESHHCTFDYKTQGRKLLKESNPLVSAPKLPKI